MTKTSATGLAFAIAGGIGIIQDIMSNSSCGGSNNDPFDGSSDIRGWRGAVTYAIAQPAEPVPTMPWGVLALTGILLGWLGKSRLNPGN